MIIEIALGIVLAVLILMFIREIFGLALILLVISIALAVVAGLLYFAFAAPELFFTLLAAGLVIGGFAWWEAEREQEREAAKQIAEADAKLKNQPEHKPPTEQELDALIYRPGDPEEDQP